MCGSLGSEVCLIQKVLGAGHPFRWHARTAIVSGSWPGGSLLTTHRARRSEHVRDLAQATPAPDSTRPTSAQLAPLPKDRPTAHVALHTTELELAPHLSRSTRLLSPGPHVCTSSNRSTCVRQASAPAAHATAPSCCAVSGSYHGLRRPWVELGLCGGHSPRRGHENPQQAEYRGGA